MTDHLVIVEDDAALNQILTLHFEEQGYRVFSALSKTEALRCIESAAPDIVLVDQKLPDGTGLDLLDRLLAQEPELLVVMITGMHDLDLAIEAIQKGAYDFIHKPIQIEELSHVISRALKQRRLAREVQALRSGNEPSVTLGDMIGQSRAMLEVSKEIAWVAKSEARVLITGESGTGKELVARAIHSHSGRRGPFLAVNCAAIVDTLLESELFGHEKGAFTGAVVRKLGKFELATEGTLFLDEIAELAPSVQAKLLRVLQAGAFERVGGTQQLSTSARVLTATNRTLNAEVRAGRFREDLLYRLNVIQIPIPPLRERRDDIPLLVPALMKRLSYSLHRPPLRVTEAAMRQLQHYDWPGNIRELENVLTQAMVRARDEVLTPDLLSLGRHSDSVSSSRLPSRGFFQDTHPADEETPLLSLDEMESQHIQRVLHKTHGHKGHTCEILGISRPALERKIQKYGLQLPNREHG